METIRDYLLYFCPEPPIETAPNEYWEITARKNELVERFSELDERLHERSSNDHGAITVLKHLDCANHLLKVLIKYCKNHALNVEDCVIDQAHLSTFTNGALEVGSLTLKPVKAEHFMALHGEIPFELPGREKLETMKKQVLLINK